jgi:putative acetyltransferase
VGIGARRIRAGLARAARNGWQGMFVVGEPMFYRRFGFDADLAEGFESPCAGPCLMALALAAALPARTGRIAYAPAFARLEERGA